jgi:MFS family permease
MAESVIFIFAAGGIIIGAMVLFGWQGLDPRLLVGILALLLIPGFYAAVTSGPFVPSARKRHKRMLELAKLKKKDIVYDLGCGDGRLVFRSAPFVKKAIGYELSIPLYLFGKLRQLFSRLPAEIRYGNIWSQDYTDGTVIYCYLLPGAMKTFYNKVWPMLRPGTRVISNSFQIHDLKPERAEENVYLYRKEA